MTELDLEALRSRWADSRRALEDNLTLDREAVRVALARRSARAFRRHSRWLWPGIVTAAVVLMALLWFVLQHRSDPVYLLPGVVLALAAAAEVVVGLRQWRALTTLDFSQPALQVQATLDAVRARRLRLTKWILLGSVLMWFPAIAVLVKGLIGADLMRAMHPSFVLGNLVVGVLFIPVALLVGRSALRRFVGDSGMQRFQDESVGGSWTRAQQQWQLQQRIEAGADDGMPSPRVTLPDGLARASRQLQWRLLAGILLCAALILAIGAFNASHGGIWPLLVPGVVLNLLFVSHMVVQILHRLQLRRLDGLMSTQQLQRHLQDMVRMREKVARATLVAMPLLVLPLLQVLAWVSSGVALHAVAGTVAATLAGLLALAASVWLRLKLRRDPGAFLPRWVDALTGGALQRTREMQRQL